MSLELDPAGPELPDADDLRVAREAPLEAGLSDTEHERLLAERIQTELACKTADDRERVGALEAEPDPWEVGDYGPAADPLPPDLADSMTDWANTHAEPEPEVEAELEMEL